MESDPWHVEELIAVLSKLGASGFIPEILRAIVITSAAILYGSYKEIWVWNRDVKKLTERYEALLAKERDEKEWWRTLAMRATGIAEMQGTVATALAKKTSAVE